MLAIGLLAGCYPDLDWKELRPPDAGFRILMPARVEASSGTGPDGVPQQRWAAQTPQALFGVTCADYPDTAAAHLGPIRDSLVRNAGGAALDERSVGEGSRQERSFAVQARAADGSERRLDVRLIARDRRLCQIAVVARPGALSEADLDTWFLSFQMTD